MFLRLEHSAVSRLRDTKGAPQQPHKTDGPVDRYRRRQTVQRREETWLPMLDGAISLRLRDTRGCESDP